MVSIRIVQQCASRCGYTLHPSALKKQKVVEAEEEKIVVTFVKIKFNYRKVGSRHRNLVEIFKIVVFK